MKLNRWLFELASYLILLTVFTSFAQATTHNRKATAMLSFRAPALRNIDKVELLSIESRMGNIEKIDETKLFEGQETQHIVSIWRKQRFYGRSAAICHQPPYAIKFYSRGKVVLFATVCWMCHNITFIIPNVKHWIEFDSDSKEAKALREVFRKAFPSENKVG